MPSSKSRHRKTISAAGSMRAVVTPARPGAATVGLPAFSFNLRQIRVARGLSQRALSRRAGVRCGFYISQLERGIVPTPAELDALAEALEVTRQTLLAEGGEARLFGKEVGGPPPETERALPARGR